MIMRDTQDIIDVALREHDIEQDLPKDTQAYTDDVLQRINAPTLIPAYSSSSRPLSLVSFQCLLQDTGFPMEVYLPGPSNGSQPDMSQLAERWVGWATEIPGQQAWSKGESAAGDAINRDSNARRELPAAVAAKYPLQGVQGSYIGALIKVYDDVTFKPASTYTVTGILSTAVLPASLDAGDEESENLVMVPTIHVLTPPVPFSTDSPSSSPSSRGESTTTEEDESTRSALVTYLSQAFSPPDLIAAELLLLLLISSPISRPVGQSPLGTLSLNFLSPQSTLASRSVINTIETLLPIVVTLPLSVSLLHSTTFNPRSSDSTTLDSGILQLASGTVLAIQEGEMGEGGQLNEKAINNLKSLAETLTHQVVRYEYPYMDGLKMECAVRGLVFSEGKSLLPVDLHLPLLQPAAETTLVNGETDSSDALPSFREYISCHASSSHASKINIPEEVAQRIQDDFVASRQDGSNRLDVEAAEQRLKRRMRIARLLAQSHTDANLSVQVWERAVRLDEEADNRMKSRLPKP